MTKTRSVKETHASFAIKGHIRKFIERLKKTLKPLASDKSHGVAAPLSLNDLPEDCISLIISFTSPRDACVFASVSKTFESAAQSDTVWEKFIPPEYESLIPRSQDFSSKKEFFFALCDESVLINVSKKNLWVEKASGKRCILLSASEINLPIVHTWKWITNPRDRFEIVPELQAARWFEIRCRTNTRFLSPRTRYSVYIVFMKADLCYGFADVAIEAVVGVVGHDLEESCRRYVCFDEATDGHGFLRRKNLVKPERREDGWMEIEIGEFFNEGGFMNSDEIEMGVLESTQRQMKRGLIIQGIETRPTKKSGNVVSKTLAFT